VVQTADDGTFDTFVPTYNFDNYRVVVVAKNPAGQVNLRDTTSTWYWTSDHLLSNHPDGDGFILAPATGLVLSNPTGDSMVFSAADALLVAHDYAVSHGVPDTSIGQAIIVPTTSNVSAHTTASGLSSIIWVPANDGSMLDDQAIMHEYGHHLQRMNNTYALWPANHDGCWANRDPNLTAISMCEVSAPLSGLPTFPTRRDLIVNSDEYAWFEGFPQYFSIVAARSNPTRVNFVTTWPKFHPAGTGRGPGATPSCDCAAATLLGSETVEGYVTSLLLDLVGSKKELETHVLSLWFNKMGTVRHPGNGMPRMKDFVALWKTEFPDDPTIDNLMRVYRMK
jgi:hypothetical protein